jgi:hypothetical protein
MGANEDVGWPVSEEYALGDGADSVQFFENGAVTLRNGKFEILVRRRRPAELLGEALAVSKVTAADLRTRKAGLGGPVLIPRPPNPEVQLRTIPGVLRAVPRFVPPAVPPAEA